MLGTYRTGDDIEEEVEEIDVEEEIPHSPHILGDENDHDNVVGGVSCACVCTYVHVYVCMVMKMIMTKSWEE
jgi:hypothetical protein